MTLERGFLYSKNQKNRGGGKGRARSAQAPFFMGGWARRSQALNYTRAAKRCSRFVFFLGWVGPQRTSTIFGCMRHYVALTAQRDYASAKRGRFFAAR